jgi:hypothetical protein
MDLLGMLRKLGDRLGIIELSVDSNQPSAPVKVQTRAITMDELLSIHLKDIKQLAEMPHELPVAFEEIFKAAGIETPPNGWSVDRLMDFLKDERIRKMQPDDAQRETLQALAAEKVDAADLVKDAILRDQALDAFAEFTIRKRETWLREKERQIQALKDQIAVEDKKWKEWRAKKRDRERDMARAVGYLIDKPVISIEDE